MTNIFVSLINYNGTQDTVACLDSLDKIDKSDILLHVIVVDNDSDTPFVLQKSMFTHLDITVIKSEKNLGFSGGHNVAIARALSDGADYVVILNNDTIVGKRFLVSMLDIFENHEKVGAVSPKVYFAKGSEFHAEKYSDKDRGNVIWYGGGILDWDNVIGKHRGVDEVDLGQFDKVSSTDFATGCCLMVPAKVLTEIGQLDERYFLYYEDSDVSMRIKKAGYQIYFAYKANIWHKNAGSTGGSGSAMQDYYITRNRLLFGMQYAPFRSKFALLKESFRQLFWGRKEQKQGVIDFYLGKFGKSETV